MLKICIYQKKAVTLQKLFKLVEQLYYTEIMKKYFLFAMIAMLCMACNTNNPEQKELVGTWSQPYHVDITVKSLTFNTDGSLIYTDKPDTTSVPVIDWAGDYAKLQYSVKDKVLHFTGYSKRSVTDSIPFAFSSSFSIKDKTLVIDSFAYDGGMNTNFIKPLELYKQ